MNTIDKNETENNVREMIRKKQKNKNIFKNIENNVVIFKSKQN